MSTQPPPLAGEPHPETLEGELLRGLVHDPAGCKGDFLPDGRLDTGYTYYDERGRPLYTIYLEGKRHSEVFVQKGVTKLNFRTLPVDPPDGSPELSGRSKRWAGGVRVDETILQACRALLVHELGPESFARVVVWDAQVVSGRIEGAEYTSHEKVVEIRHREDELVARFVEYLLSQERPSVSRNIQINGKTIVSDVYDSKEHILFEAKADSADRSMLRMAIGQLYDYAHFGFRDPKERRRLRLAVVLPGRPAADFEELLGSLGIGLAWAEDGGFVERL